MPILNSISKPAFGQCMVTGCLSFFIDTGTTKVCYDTTSQRDPTMCKSVCVVMMATERSSTVGYVDLMSVLLINGNKTNLISEKMLYQSNYFSMLLIRKVGLIL